MSDNRFEQRVEIDLAQVVLGYKCDACQQSFKWSGPWAEADGVKCTHCGYRDPATFDSIAARVKAAVAKQAKSHIASEMNEMLSGLARKNPNFKWTPPKQ